MHFKRLILTTFFMQGWMRLCICFECHNIYAVNAILRFIKIVQSFNSNIEFFSPKETFQNYVAEGASYFQIASQTLCRSELQRYAGYVGLLIKIKYK